jgi:asparagine synthase (glutamine-hydrolysing)
VAGLLVNVRPDGLRPEGIPEGTSSAFEVLGGGSRTRSEAIGESTVAHDRSGRWTVVFDGSLFDRTSLTRSMDDYGRQPRTKDAELVAEAVGAWGVEAALLRISWDGNLVAWDRLTGEVFASRDRFGTRPLYYAHTSRGGLVLADALRAFPRFGFAEPDRAALLFSTYLLETTPRTFLLGVSATQPGTIIRFRAGRRPLVTRWWRTIDHVERIGSDRAIVEEGLRERVLDAVRRRIPPSGAFATSLSGGLDSSVIAAVVDLVLRERGQDPRRQVLHHQSFAGSPQDESRFARSVADYLGLPLVDTAITPREEIHHLHASVLDFEGDHYMPLTVWCHFRRIARTDLGFSFEGLGADSLFAGAVNVEREIRQAALRQGRLLRWAQHVREAPFREALKGDLMATLGPNVIAAAARRARSRHGVVGGCLRALTRSRRTARLPAGLLEEVEEVEWALAEREADVAREADGLDPINRNLYRRLHLSSTPADSRNFWRLASAHGVVPLNPFLDPRVVTFAFGVPGHMKLAEGWTKLILRQAFAPLLPDDIVWRRDKLGFTAPMIEWTSVALREVMVAAAREGLRLPDGESERVAHAIVRADRADDITALRRLWPSVQRSILLSGFHGDIQQRNT